MEDNKDTDASSDSDDSISTDALMENSVHVPISDHNDGIIDVDKSGNLSLQPSLVDDYHYCPSELVSFSLWDFCARVEKIKCTYTP